MLSNCAPHHAVIASKGSANRWRIPVTVNPKWKTAQQGTHASIVDLAPTANQVETDYMTRQHLQRRPIPRWQVVPLILIPPAVVAAVCLAQNWSLTPFLYTCLLSVMALILLDAPRSPLRWALAGIMAMLGLLLIITGGNPVAWAAAAFTWAVPGLRSGM
jgi:hypothetical protein